MIKIPISNKQKEEVEKIYWNWLNTWHLKKLLAIIERDAVFKELIKNGEEDIAIALKKYLLSNYDELEQLRLKIDKMRTKNQYINITTKYYLKARYENYRESQAAKVVNAIGITVCPYCNQNHLNIVYKGGKIRYWGDLDHFYNKKTYPELAICLYNMIPVCKVCNQLKSSQEKAIVNPYNYKEKSYIKFKTVFDDKFDLDYLQGKSQNFNIVIDEEQLTQEDEEEIRLFDIENRYKQLKQNVQEIIIKSKAYDVIYQKQLEQKFNLNDDELNSYIFGYTDNHLSRILSKFNLDIADEFRNHEKKKESD
jgi:hypothetical protein